MHSRFRTVRRDKRRQDETRQDKTRHDRTSQDKTSQDKARQEKTKRGETRQDNTRQDKPFLGGFPRRCRGGMRLARRYNTRLASAQNDDESLRLARQYSTQLPLVCTRLYEDSRRRRVSAPDEMKRRRQVFLRIAWWRKSLRAVSAGVLVSTDGCERLALSEGLVVACALFESPG